MSASYNLNNMYLEGSAIKYVDLYIEFYNNSDKPLEAPLKFLELTGPMCRFYNVITKKNINVSRSLADPSLSKELTVINPREKGRIHNLISNHYFKQINDMKADIIADISFGTKLYYKNQKMPISEYSQGKLEPIFFKFKTSLTFFYKDILKIVG